MDTTNFDENRKMNTFFNGRSTIDNSSSLPKITIPAKKNFFSIFGAVSILVLYFFAAMFLVYAFDLVDGNKINFLFLLASAVLILVFVPVLFLLLWNLFGKEKIIIQSNRLVTSRNLFGVEFSYKDYLVQHLGNFRYNDINYAKNPYKSILFPFGLGEGNIKFDYGVKTCATGFGLDEAEVTYLIELIQEKLGLKVAS